MRQFDFNLDAWCWKNIICDLLETFSTILKVMLRRKNFTIYDLISEDQHYFEEMNTTWGGWFSAKAIPSVNNPFSYYGASYEQWWEVGKNNLWGLCLLVAFELGQEDKFWWERVSCLKAFKIVTLTLAFLCILQVWISLLCFYFEPFDYRVLSHPEDGIDGEILFLWMANYLIEKEIPKMALLAKS